MLGSFLSTQVELNTTTCPTPALLHADMPDVVCALRSNLLGETRNTVSAFESRIAGKRLPGEFISAFIILTPFLIRSEFLAASGSLF